MGLFKKKPIEMITISSPEKAALISFYKSIEAKQLKSLTLSGLFQNDEGFVFSITCEDATEVYSNILMPLVYESTPEKYQILVQFDDKINKSRFYPKEVVVSLKLDSGKDFGSNKEQSFIWKIKEAMTAENEAALSYMIVGGGAVTMSVACNDTNKIEGVVKKLMASNSISLYRINTVTRERA